MAVLSLSYGTVRLSAETLLNIIGFVYLDHTFHLEIGPSTRFRTRDAVKEPRIQAQSTYSGIQS